MSKSIAEQQGIAERLQLKLLQRFERLLDSEELSPTDAATLTRLLCQNGWILDPRSVPQSLRDKIRNLPPLDQEPDPDEQWGDAADA